MINVHYFIFSIFTALDFINVIFGGSVMYLVVIFAELKSGGQKNVKIRS